MISPRKSTPWAGKDGLTVRFTAPSENAPRPMAASPKKKCCLPASEAHAATPSPVPVHERDLGQRQGVPKR